MELAAAEGIGRLPEGCISHVLSLTSPRDACRAAATDAMFRSAAESDAVWEAFLPMDYTEIISRAVSPVEHGSKKEMYFRLCDDPILIDDGKKSFALDKPTGKKCFMLSARDLEIAWGATPIYWAWNSDPGSRFSEVAELLYVCWLEIRGKMDTAGLSHNTTYAAYLVYKIAQESLGLEFPYAEAFVTVGPHSSREAACLKLNPDMQQLRELAVNLPCARGDGWMEVSMGEFFSDEGHDGELDVGLKEIEGGHWKRGLIVQGIELRPKK